MCTVVGHHRQNGKDVVVLEVLYTLGFGGFRTQVLLPSGLV
jgi:hypothetical protein